MSFANFIPTVWNTTINRELERLCVFAQDCNRQYEGDVRELGDQVKILGVGKPTITTIARSAAGNDINAAETVADTSIFLQINQISYFNYIVGDIDKAQAVSGLAEALQLETSEALAYTMDKYIAGFACTAKGATMLDALGSAVLVSTTSTDAGYALTLLDRAQQALYEKNVSPDTELIATVTPRFWFKIRKCLTALDTNNSARLTNGEVGQYGKMKIRMSNACITATSGTVDSAGSGGTEDLMMVRTKRAVAFVNPMTHTEAYRPDLKFADAIKGFVLYDAKIVRPKELVVLNVKYA